MATPFDRIIAQGGAERDRFFAERERLRLQEERLEQQRQAAEFQQSLATTRENRLDSAQQTRDALFAATARSNRESAQREEDMGFADRVASGELVQSPPDFSKLDLTTGFPVMPERVLESNQIRRRGGGVGSVFGVVSPQDAAQADIEQRFGKDSLEANQAFIRGRVGANLPGEPTESPPQSIGAMRARAAADLRTAREANDQFGQVAAQGRLNNLNTIEAATKRTTALPTPTRELNATERSERNQGLLTNAVLDQRVPKPISQMGLLEKNSFARKIIQDQGIDPDSVQGLQMIGGLRSEMNIFEPPGSSSVGPGTFPNIVTAILAETTTEGLKDLIRDGQLPNSPDVLAALRQNNLITEEEVLAAIQ